MLQTSNYPFFLCACPCPGSPSALNTSHRCLHPSKKAADFLDSALAEPSVQQEMLLILSQHSHDGAAAARGVRPVQTLLDEVQQPHGKWRGICWRLPWPWEPEREI